MAFSWKKIPNLTSDMAIKTLNDFLGKAASKINSLWPVGSIFLSTSPTNPTDYFGGTWVAWGTGRVPVGIDAGQTEFDTVEKTGGDKALQKHDHTVRMSTDSTPTAGNFYGYSVLEFTMRFQKDGQWGGYGSVDGAGLTGDAGTGVSGNLQPYITCYMWKRTA